LSHHPAARDEPLPESSRASAATEPVVRSLLPEACYSEEAEYAKTGWSWARLRADSADPSAVQGRSTRESKRYELGAKGNEGRMKIADVWTDLSDAQLVALICVLRQGSHETDEPVGIVRLLEEEIARRRKGTYTMDELAAHSPHKPAAADIATVNGAERARRAATAHQQRRRIGRTSI
jgi:hypothetical protein